MRGNQITLSTETVLTLARWHGGEPHHVLATTPLWHSQQALDELDERATAELADHGVDAGAGRLGELTGAINALVGPRLEYFGWVQTTVGDDAGDTAHLGILAATTGSGPDTESFVVVRVRETDRISISRVPEPRLLSAFVAEVPNAPAARGMAASVPRSEYERVYGTDGGTTRQRGATSNELRAISRVLEQPRIGAGSLYAARRGRSGTRHRVAVPVNYVDTVNGRWLTQITTYGSTREEWVTVAPANRDLLGSRLSEQLAKLPT